ncbi:hypothetical protein [Streptomyces yatensis]|uniref:Integral membrane protein n=1 Tax=Streptomyces yatensis TaxID=155177 RepID=A0ABN2J504_9ACTN|nr:hypothetical protein [Streptomyces yatensis]
MSDPVPPPAEAARALRDIERLRAQGRASERQSRWVGVVFGLAIFAELAAPDFFGDGVRSGVSLAVTALVVAYAVMLRTPRGAALLGRPTRVRRSEISPRFARTSQLTILAIVLLGFVGALFMPDHLFPYAGTVAGAVLGATLIIFGRSLQRGLNSLAMRGDGKDGMSGVAHGSR